MEVTRRDSQAADGSPIHAGDVMGIEDGAITVVGSSVKDVTVELIRRMQEAEEGDTLTILAGADLDDASFRRFSTPSRQPSPLESTLTVVSSPSIPSSSPSSSCPWVSRSRRPRALP